MMQPPRQIVAIAPRSMFQPYSSLPARDLVEALRVGDDLRGVQRLPDVLDERLAVVDGRGPAGVAGQAAARPPRCSAWPDSERANTASAMPVTGTPRSSAICTVQRPVPFCSAWSATTSTNGLPVAGVDVAEHLGGDLDQERLEVAGVPARGRSRRSRPGVRPAPMRSRSYASAISCMSAYSMPLCTIFTKWPAPSGPTWVQHGAPSTCGGDRLEHRAERLRTTRPSRRA